MHIAGVHRPRDRSLEAPAICQEPSRRLPIFTLSATIGIFWGQPVAICSQDTLSGILFRACWADAIRRVSHALVLRFRNNVPMVVMLLIEVTPGVDD
jgi:hypothetical protein